MDQPKMGIQKAIVAFVTSAVALAALLAPQFGFEIRPETQTAIIGASTTAAPLLVWLIPNKVKEAGTGSGSGGIPSIAIMLALLVPLGGCEFLRGLNTPENRQAGVEAAVAAIEALNADGFDPIQLDDTERALAVTACRVLAAYLPTLEDDIDRRADLVALGMDVCGVLGVALAPAAPVEAPEPIPVPEVAS